MGWPAGSVGEYLDYLGPGLTDGPCPPWPPDVFALAASVLRRTGTYVLAEGLLENGWQELAGKLGAQWRRVVGDALGSESDSQEKMRGRLQGANLPGQLERWWASVVAGAGISLEDLSGNDEICRSLLKLCLVADEACEGLGIDVDPEVAEPMLRHAEIPILEENGWASLCLAVRPEKARVLPKQHTPQRGSTVRSLSHYLALCPANEVKVTWSSPFKLAGSRKLLAMNLLLLPWPLEITASHFEHKESRDLPEPYSFFSFKHQADPSNGSFQRYFEAALEEARKHAHRIDGIVLPELALTYQEYLETEKTALKERSLLIAGVAVEAGVGGFSDTTNTCFVQPAGLRDDFRELPQILERSRVQQAKHHRWCLDRRQILQYRLGGMLPASQSCWEDTHIGRRCVHFTTLSPWMTLSVLVCEDLARQDPVSDILRAVGPNLVVALLMDGPQTKTRWSSRYASVLADDPGCSVLTLTSLGMSVRSQPPPGEPDRSRVIALWRDVCYGEKELELEDGCNAAVLSLVSESLEEFTADGRSDGRTARFPVFAGFRSFRAEPRS